VAADKGIFDVIRATIADKSASGRPIETLPLARAEEVRGCDLAFIGAGERSRLEAIAKAAAGTSTLLVSEADAFGREVAMINLILADNRIRLEIDPEAAARAQLKISSKLLSLAQIVGQTPASPAGELP
jgi:CelD/BcsL family acetyltransferase involved in cellulose biosynthesis